MTIGVAACTFEISVGTDGEAGSSIQLLPAGEFRARDGRPAECPAWRTSPAIAAAMVARSRSRATPFVIDYEHQTLLADSNGQPAPAAGWFKSLAWHDPLPHPSPLQGEGAGGGLFAADVDWTARAKAMIAAKEYRYLSPVFAYDRQTGAVLELLHAGLTNVPAIDGMSELTARAAARLTFPSEEPPMQELLKLLGLPETATAAEALAALRGLQQQTATAEREVAALKTQAPDPAQYVPAAAVQAIQTELAALKTGALARDIDDLVKPALADGRLLPALEPWARDLGRSNLAALKTYLEQAQPIAALRGTQTGGKGPDDTGSQLSPEELAVCRQFGVAPDDYRKTKTAQRAA